MYFYGGFVHLIFISFPACHPNRVKKIPLKKFTEKKFTRHFGGLEEKKRGNSRISTGNRCENPQGIPWKYFSKNFHVEKFLKNRRRGK